MYKIINTKLEGCMEIMPRIFNDFRGTSIKTMHKPSLEKLGIVHDFKEQLVVASKKGVIRGLHFQKPPFEQAKLISCLKGSIIDVAVDLRPTSATYGQYHTFLLSDQIQNMAYIPTGFAHGYGVLEEDSIVSYLMSEVYNVESEGGISWDSFDIDWQIEEPIISDKDKMLDKFL